ncbi:unnamed protein product [Rotaria socialis]|uniref:Uncharacterized protein n=1 Tax=Rotaria socialis TaxID=392032 RepID=A0A820YBE1_9BILA|nr:unnamed protein product [Rotaria socialis]
MDVDVQDALELLVLIKDLDIQFNSIRQENEKHSFDYRKKSIIDLSSFHESSKDEKFDDVIPEKYLDSVVTDLINAMRVKYQISADRYDEFYGKLVRSKLVDFLADERKRHRKSTSTQSSISLSGS